MCVVFSVGPLGRVGGVVLVADGSPFSAAAGRSWTSESWFILGIFRELMMDRS